MLSRAGEEKIKHVQIRLEDHEVAVFRAKMKTLGLGNIQHAAKSALLAWATDKHAVALPEEATLDQVLIRLETLHQGQSTILEVLREFTRKPAKNHPMVESEKPVHTKTLGPQISGIPLDLSEHVRESIRSPDSPKPVEKDRPPEQKAPPTTRTRRRKH